MWAAGLIAASLVLRLIYVVVIADYENMISPASGPDSPIYSAAAAALRDRGWLAADVPGVPFWPFGYPLFLATTYAFSPSVYTPIVVQNLLLALGMASTYRLVSRELSSDVALGTVVLLVISPALNFSATVFMYESLLAVAAVVMCDLVSAGLRRPRGQARTGHLVSGFFVGGIGALLQPKLLAVAVAVGIWLLWRIRDMALIGLCALALLIPVGGGVLRNWMAGEPAVLSANLGFTVLMGANEHATGGYVKDTVVAATCGNRPTSFRPESDKVWRNCGLSWAREHPVEIATLTLPKAAHFWMPFSGNLGRRGTWRHPLDHSAVLGQPGQQNAGVKIADNALGVVWMMATLGLIGNGIRRMAQRKELMPTLLLLVLPIATFLLISMVTIGDARFRLPVAPFYSALMAYGIVEPRRTHRAPSR